MQHDKKTSTFEAANLANASAGRDIALSRMRDPRTAHQSVPTTIRRGRPSGPSLPGFGRKPRKNKFLNAAATVFAITAFLCLSLSANADIKVGDSFPDLAPYKLEGKLPDQTKDKVVLVDFWASWCGPCGQSFPAMEELQKKYGPQGFVIIAVNVDEKKRDMEDFLKDHHVSFIVVRDGKQKLVEKAGISTMPSSFLIDQHGKVVFAHSGFHGSETTKQYEREIESLLRNTK